MKTWPSSWAASGSTLPRGRPGEVRWLRRSVCGGSLSSIGSTWPLLLGMGVLMLGAGLQGTLLGLRATLEGFPTPVTGIIMSCYYVGYLLGTSAAPRMIRQIGHIRVFAALAAMASATILVQAAFVQSFL